MLVEQVLPPDSKLKGPYKIPCPISDPPLDKGCISKNQNPKKLVWASFKSQDLSSMFLDW